MLALQPLWREERRLARKNRAQRSVVEDSRMEENRRFRTQQILIVPDIFHVVSGEGGPEEGVGCCQSKWKWPGWAGPSDTLYRRVGGGYLTWDWAALATDTRTVCLSKRIAPEPSHSDSSSISDWELQLSQAWRRSRRIWTFASATQLSSSLWTVSSCFNTRTWNFSQRILQCHSEKNPRT